jgi:hypothetical protein
MTVSDWSTLARIFVYLLIVLAWLIPARSTLHSKMNGARKVLLLTFGALISWPLSLALMAAYSLFYDVVPRDFWFVTIGLNLVVAIMVLHELWVLDQEKNGDSPG